MSEGWSPARRSGDLRHTLHSAESCCRQALTRFTVHRCAGPDRRARRQPFAREDSVGGCSDEEGCESGRIGTIGNRVWGNPPWVQIPPSPLRGPYERGGFEVTKTPAGGPKGLQAGGGLVLGRGRQTSGAGRDRPGCAAGACCAHLGVMRRRARRSGDRRLCG
jgi:hypothetical protein